MMHPIELPGTGHRHRETAKSPTDAKFPRDPPNAVQPLA
jgi:hypothetical protein